MKLTVGLKHSIVQLENSEAKTPKKSSIEKILGWEDEVENLERSGKKYEKLKKTIKHAETVGYHEKAKLSNYRQS